MIERHGEPPIQRGGGVIGAEGDTEEDVLDDLRRRYGGAFGN